MFLGRLLKRRSAKRVRDVSAQEYAASRGRIAVLRTARIAPTKTVAQLLELDSGWLYTPLCVPVAAGRCTTLEVHRIYSRDKYDVMYTDAFAEALDACSAPAADNVFVLATGRNYWHFLMDFMPRLCFAAAMPELRERALLVDAGTTETERSIVERVAARVGIAQPRLVRAAGALQPIANASCPGRIDRYSAAALWDELLYPVSARPRRGIERLFVTRVAEKRRAVNEDALADQLQRLGFTCLDPGTLDFDEQVALFTDARVIVGVHGSALANLVFAPRGAIFVELYTTVAQAFFSDLADAKGFRYVPIAGQPTGASRDHDDDFSIDVVRVLDVLKELGVR